jgi:hypothetical protein
VEAAKFKEFIMDFNDNMMFTAKEYEILINSVKHLEDEEVEDFIH